MSSPKYSNLLWQGGANEAKLFNPRRVLFRLACKARIHGATLRAILHAMLHRVSEPLEIKVQWPWRQPEKSSSFEIKPGLRFLFTSQKKFFTSIFNTPKSHHKTPNQTKASDCKFHNQKRAPHQQWVWVDLPPQCLVHFCSRNYM